MSSEAEARGQVLAEMGRWVVDGVDHQALISGVARAVAVLDAYKEQIERRVLAQQPCYRLGWPSDEGGVNCVELRLMCAEHTHQPPTLCPTCTARAAQTQETSG